MDCLMLKNLNIYYNNVRMIDQERCKRVVNAIRDLSQTEVDELFKLLHKDQCMYTQNNNGIFFNLSRVSEETMTKIEQFIEFCHHSSKELVKYETLCDVLNHTLHCQETKDFSEKTILKMKQKTTRDTIDETELDKKNIVSAKISSSMKFYLLKKRFSKPLIMMTNYESDLISEKYIIQ